MFDVFLIFLNLETYGIFPGFFKRRETREGSLEIIPGPGIPGMG